MPRMTILCAALLVALVAGTDENAWGPADSVTALAAVEEAVDKIVTLPHLSLEQSKRARQVVEDVKKDIDDVESSKALTKQERNAKVGAAIKELSDLQSDWVKLAAHPADKQEQLKEKMATLQKELADKQSELEKDKSMIKLFTLQKQLTEKKLELQKLLEKKSAAGTSKSAQRQQADEESAMASKLSVVVHGLASVSAKAELPKPLKAVMTDLVAEKNKVAESIDKMTEAEKQANAQMETMAKTVLPTEGKEDAIAKGKHMLMKLEAEEHRKFAKARAMKKTEYNELNEAEHAIEHRDGKRLEATLAKMQGNAKALVAKSGDFLH